MSPSFLEHNFYGRGRLGYWTTQPAMAVTAHHHFSGTGDPVASKLMMQLHAGWWNFTVGGFATQHKANSSTKLLAFSPAVRDAMARLVWTEAGLRNMLLGLVQVATLLGRTLVWPAMPCVSRFLQPGYDPKQPPRMKLPFHTIAKRTVLPYGADPYTDPGRVRCALLDVVGTISCHGTHLGGGVGPPSITEIEFEQYYLAVLNRDRPHLASPTADTTLLAPAPALAAEVASSDSNLRNVMLLLTPQQVLDTAAGTEAAQVLYLGHPVLVDAALHAQQHAAGAQQQGATSGSSASAAGPPQVYPNKWHEPWVCEPLKLRRVKDGKNISYHLRLKRGVVDRVTRVLSRAAPRGDNEF